MTRTKNELSRSKDFMKLYSHLECMFARTRTASASGTSLENGLVSLLKFYIAFSSSRLIVKFYFIDPHVYTYVSLAVDLLNN